MDKLILRSSLTIQYISRLATVVILCATASSFPLFASSHNAINQSNSSQLEQDCTFQVDPQHQTFYCVEKFSPESVLQPNISSSCGSIQSTNYQDEYLDLGCTSNGFTGYFMMPNWHSSKIKGDGGVDVTGAPNSILVEGANKALVNVAAGSLVQHSIVVPAEGYMAFDWSYIGGSNLSSHNVSLMINDQLIPLDNPFAASGKHYTDLLSPGDVFGFQINNTRGTETLVVSIKEFQFLTNAIGVTRRNWTAVDALGNETQFTQLITFERATIADVIFPANIDGSGSPILDQNASSLPASTGYPVIDKDGNPDTISDQYRLDESDCAFEVKWIDGQLQDGAFSMIQRQWIITDWCSGSILEETQIIKIAGTPTVPKQIPNGYEDGISAESQKKTASWSVTADTE